MQIGPRIRVGGSIGHFGEQVKHTLGNVLAGGQSLSMFGHKFSTPLALITSPIAAKLQGKSDSDAFRSEEDILRATLRSAAVAASLYGGGQAMGAFGGGGGNAAALAADPSVADAAAGTAAGAGAGAAGAAGGAAAGGAAAGAAGGMSLATKLALFGMLAQAGSGIAGGVAQGKEANYQHDQNNQRLAAMNRFRQGLQPPSPFQFQSPFGAQNNLAAQQGQMGGGMNPLLRNQWAQALAQRGIGG